VRNWVVVAIVAALLATGCSSTKTQTDRLPDVTLHGLDGAPAVNLGTLKGPVVVNLWAWWCGPCKRELPLYAEFARKYQGKVAVLGVDFQETKPDQAVKLASSAGVGYPLVVDPDGRLKAPGLPKLILLDARGKIAYQEYVEIKSLGQLERLVARHLGVAAS
jgi:cytochrome c biogenesis protein CcmG/thiol:disulfide interchange protein DsbE